jgi:hypothetical protein
MDGPFAHLRRFGHVNKPSGVPAWSTSYYSDLNVSSYWRQRQLTLINDIMPYYCRNTMDTRYCRATYSRQVVGFSVNGRWALVEYEHRYEHEEERPIGEKFVSCSVPTMVLIRFDTI